MTFCIAGLHIESQIVCVAICHGTPECMFFAAFCRLETMCRTTRTELCIFLCGWHTVLYCVFVGMPNGIAGTVLVAARACWPEVKQLGNRSI